MHMVRRLIVTILIVGALVLTTAFVFSERGEVSESRAYGELSRSYPPIVVEPRTQSLPGYRELRALAAAYPERITEIELRDGEWAVRMDETWYYWAQGRLLPIELRDRAADFVSLRFYRYQPGPLRQREINEELAVRLRDRTASRSGGETDTRVRFNSFLDNLYEISSEREADILVRPITFLGYRTRVHPMIIEPLRRVEATVRSAMEREPEVRAFVGDLHSVHGYNWRNIAGTLRRSYHSYGVAVDFVPRSYGGKWPYWLWAAEGGVSEWWEVPLEERWQVPLRIIEAFEAEGFIWGGKWLSFDNLHFEYRPESLLLTQWRDSSLRPSDTRRSLSP